MGGDLGFASPVQLVTSQMRALSPEQAREDQCRPKRCTSDRKVARHMEQNHTCRPLRRQSRWTVRVASISVRSSCSQFRFAVPVRAACASNQFAVELCGSAVPFAAF